MPRSDDLMDELELMRRKLRRHLEFSPVNTSSRGTSHTNRFYNNNYIDADDDEEEERKSVSTITGGSVYLDRCVAAVNNNNSDTDVGGIGLANNRNKCSVAHGVIKALADQVVELQERLNRGTHQTRRERTTMFKERNNQGLERLKALAASTSKASMSIWAENENEDDEDDEEQRDVSRFDIPRIPERNRYADDHGDDEVYRRLEQFGKRYRNLVFGRREEEEEMERNYDVGVQANLGAVTSPQKTIEPKKVTKKKKVIKKKALVPAVASRYLSPTRVRTNNNNNNNINSNHHHYATATTAATAAKKKKILKKKKKVTATIHCPQCRHHSSNKDDFGPPLFISRKQQH